MQTSVKKIKSKGLPQFTNKKIPAIALYDSFTNMRATDTMKKEIDPRLLRLTTINGDNINGQVNIKRNQGFDRTSDLIADKTEEYLVVMNATVHPKDSNSPMQFETLFVNKEHVIWAAPEDYEK